MSGHSGKPESHRHAEKRYVPRRRARIAPGEARRNSRSRLARAGLLALAMALGGGVAAFAAPGGSAQQLVTCVLELPDQPLTAQGLATPFKLEGANGQACHEADPDTAAFVQGMVLDPATGALSVYDPLVIDEGTQAAVPPVVPQLPSDAVVALWFGFNGDVLTLKGGAGGHCVTGLGDSPFGQFSYCNAPAFFKAANNEIAAGQISIPPLGTAKDGEPCMSTRDFGLVDQDQSDNVTSTYLALPDGQTAQNTQAAAAALSNQNPGILSNGSDNLLLDAFVDPAIGCSPWTVPDLANGGQPATALGLDEIQASAYQGAPVALVPLNDPMTLDNQGNYSTAKTNLYRAGVDQVPLFRESGSPSAYCAQIRLIGVQRTELDQPFETNFASPDPAAANLFAFMAQRLQASYENLNCDQLLGEPNPVSLITDGNGVVTGATFNLSTGGASASASSSSSATTTASASPSTTASTSPSAGMSGSTTPSTSPSSAYPTAPTQPAYSSSAYPTAPQTTHSSGGGSGSGGGSAPSSSPYPATSPSTKVQSSPQVQPNPGASGAVSPSASASGSASPSSSAAAGKGASTGPSAAAGAGSGGSGSNGRTGAMPTATAPFTGFDQGFQTLTADNPHSALYGPSQLSPAGKSLINSRVLWAVAGAFVVLCLTLLLKRPRVGRR